MTDENLQAGPDRSRPLRSSGLWTGDGTTRNEDAAAAGARVCPCRDAGWSWARPPGGRQGPGAQPQRGRPVCEGRPCGVPGLLRAPCPAGASCASSLLPGLPRKPPGTSRRTLQSVCGQVLWPQRPCHALPSLLVTVPSLLQGLSQCLLLSSVAVRARHSVRPMPPAPTVRPALHARMSRAARGFQSLQTPPLPAKLSLQSS